GLDDLQSLGDLLLLRLAARLGELETELLRHRVDVDVAKELEDGLAAHARLERVVTELVEELLVAVLREDLAALERGLARVEHDVALAVEHALELLERDVEDGADAAREALQEPDVRHGGRQRDVAEALAPDLRLDDLDAALLADDAT